MKAIFRFVLLITAGTLYERLVHLTNESHVSAIPLQWKYAMELQSCL